MKFFRRLKQAWNEATLEAAKQTYYQCNIAPWVIPAIGAVGSIFSGIFGSSAKKGQPEKEAAAQYKYGKKAAEDRITRADKAGLKPTTPRHEYWSGLSQIAPFMQNAVMGSFVDIFGADTLAKWGASYDPSGAGGNAPAQLPPDAGVPPGGGGGERPMPPWMEGRKAPGRGEGGGPGRRF